MRRIVLISILCACALSALAYNEQVAAIAYNPSRLGAYRQLRVTKTATLQGGANVDANGSMNIESNVTLKDETNKCEEGTGKCDKANLNQITTIVPDGEDTTNTSADVSGTLQKYKENSVYIGSYNIDGTSPAADQGTRVNVLGGELTATGDSYIDNFKSDTVSKLTVTANELSVGTDTTSAVFGTTESLKLGGIKVNKSDCVGKCKEYQWVERLPDGATEAVKVLAVKVN